MTTRSLPEAFKDLERLTAEWALTNERDRLEKLANTSISDLRAFYDAMLPRAASARDYLIGRPIDALAADSETLFHLLMTFVETAYPIEFGWTTTQAGGAFASGRLTFGPAGTSSPVGIDNRSPRPNRSSDGSRGENRAIGNGAGAATGPFARSRDMV